MLNRKGQIFTTDLIVAGVVFLFIITFTSIYSNEISYRVALIEEEEARENAALGVMDLLMLTPGKPANWEKFSDLNRVASIGVAYAIGGIDEEKFAHLVDMNNTHYEAITYLLGAGAYGVNISVLSLQNRQVRAEFGTEPLPTDNITSVSRPAFYNGEDVLLRVMLFESAAEGE